MEEPVKAAEAIDHFNSSTDNSSTQILLPKIQVKSQNPISKKPIVFESYHEPLSSGKTLDQKGLSPKPIERLQGGGSPVKLHRNTMPLKSSKSPLQAQTPKSPKISVYSPKTSVYSPKTSVYSPKTSITQASPKTSITQASPKTSITQVSPKDVVDKPTNMETSPTYPYNLWGPITKYGYLYDVTPTWVQRCHFQGKQDKLAKKRLHAREFSYVRHPEYKELIEPEEKTCASYLDPKRKEFWRTDTANVLNREMRAKKDQYKRVLEKLGNEEGYRKSELQKDREDRWQAFLDYDKNVKWYPGFRNNQSGVKYNIITKACTDEYEEKRMNAENMKDRYMLAKRGLYIQERMSGARPFDIISWRKLPNSLKLPEWPEDIGPPPGPRHDENMIPLNASKGTLSFAYPFGPFGTVATGR